MIFILFRLQDSIFFFMEKNIFRFINYNMWIRMWIYNFDKFFWTIYEIVI